MNLRERASAHFLRSAAAHEDAATSLVEAVTAAGELLAHCLLGGHKIMTTGEGSAAASALYLRHLLINRYQRERPGLPCLSLLGEAGIERDTDAALARRIRTLGQAGDCLVYFPGVEPLGPLTASTTALKDREISLVVLDNGADGAGTQLMQCATVYVPAGSASSALCHELHTTTIHCMCDLIDIQIFGEELS